MCSFLTDKEDAPILAPNPPPVQQAGTCDHGDDVTDSDGNAMTTDGGPDVAGCDVYDPAIDETIPPFRLGPEPSGLRAGAWLRRWGIGLAGWGLFVLVVYLTAGEHLNAYLSLAGLMIGFLVGFTGMGGGALMTPVLIFFFGFEPTMAIGTDITYAAVTKIAGSWKHWRQGSVDIPLALWLALGSIPASLLGVATIAYVKATYGGDLINGVLYKAIGSALMMVGVLLIVKVVMHVDAAHRCENIRMTRKLKVMTVCLGLCTGFVIGFTSVGSGTLLAVFLILFYPLTTDRIVGTDIFHAMILLLVTALAQMGVGNVDLWMVASLLMGSIPGVLLGSQLTAKAPTRVLRACLAAVLFLSGIALLFKG
jgi:uncharacterized membrane protein YfcA